MNPLGGLEIGEQTILTNFYLSLISNGSLNWDLSTDLCGQTGVICDSSDPKRVVQLYFSFFFSNEFPRIVFYLRNLNSFSISGTISIEFGNLRNLQQL